MKIEINIDELTVNSVIAQTWERDEEGEIVGERGVRLGDAIVDHLVKAIRNGDGWNDDLKSRIAKIRDEEIRIRVRDELEAALTIPIAATNQFGEKTGAPTTLRQMIFDQAAKALGRSGSRYESDKTLMEKIVSSEVEKALTAEVKPIVDQAKKDVKMNAERIATSILADVALRVSGTK